MLRFPEQGRLGGNPNSLTVSGGVLDLGATTQIQNGGLTLGGGTIQNGTLSSTGTFGLQSGAVSAVLAGTGDVVKNTAGTVTLSGVNTYTGATTINAGTLALSGAGASRVRAAFRSRQAGTFDISQTITGAYDPGHQLPEYDPVLIDNPTSAPGDLPTSARVSLGSKTLIITSG